MIRIVCIGNRYVEADAAGPRVFDRLHARAIPAGVVVTDGGIAGLGLLGLLEGAARVVFVDALAEDDPSQDVVRLSAEEVAATARPAATHAAGLPYLLRILPEVLDAAPPEIVIVGVPSFADDAMLDRAVSAALDAVHVSLERVPPIGAGEAS